MKFVLLFGPQAVGKMTVGQELEKITGLKLFHNHMTIELLQPFFGFESEMWRLSTHFREEIFKSAAKSNMDGMIFTFVWAFNLQEDWDFVENTCKIFREKGADIYFAELEAEVEERVLRNNTPNRLKHKPTKRNVNHSEQELLRSLETYRLNSLPDEVDIENYIRINNTHMTAEEVARKIKEEFLL
ncbi:shikimate kinase [Evansella cellulosilytica]|uniref:Shikimate kinase n=1 Tax=Evansella cellulosilytica (strain ATCC 21833 / DSM 2522 / FERM P-1141 / JCM 9156 / N-4) TaxID=649639 RepID=E6TZ60_EVAC2|nr:shikimate kinase [Evansella cellulosilytica]ADU28922.1 shikimate kinase [Evansella cellulosilytica DSM 2522]